MSYVIINPGTGDVPGACPAEAESNTHRLLSEAGVVAIVKRAPRRENGRGRFAFMCKVKGRRALEVLMPGVPYEALQLTESQQLPFPPRLYVDGNSWWWPYAVDMVRGHFAKAKRARV